MQAVKQTQLPIFCLYKALSGIYLLVAEIRPYTHFKF